MQQLYLMEKQYVADLDRVLQCQVDLAVIKVTDGSLSLKSLMDMPIAGCLKGMCSMCMEMY